MESQKMFMQYMKHFSPERKLNIVMTNNMISAKRYDIFDVAKGIGIILVVIGHMHPFFDYNSKTYTIIYAFHMPLFICISGVFINHLQKGFVQKRFRQIMLPYFIASISSIFYEWPEDRSTAIRYFNGILIGNTQNGGLSYNISLWYLPMIFCACIFFYFGLVISERKNGRKYLPGYILALSATGFMLLGHNIRLPWNVETALISQIFIYAGFLIGKYAKFDRRNDRYPVIFLLLFVLAVISFFTYGINGRVDMNAGVYNNLFLYFTNAFSGIGIILLISLLICHFASPLKNILCLLGQKSLYIMMFHVPLSKFFYSEEILSLLPKIISDNLWNKNMIGLSYPIITSILFSLFISYIYDFFFKNI